MCKQEGNSHCSELTADIPSWSKYAPLAKPEWITESVDIFVDAFNLTMGGEIAAARKIINNSRDIDLRTWFDEHAQNSGTWRYKALRMKAPDAVLPLDPVSKPTNFLAEIFFRDRFRCRYCESKVIPKSVFKKMQGLLGQDSKGIDFVPLGGTNMTRSGFYLMFAATLDHVIPWSLGGRTEASNLVTSCWSCNYGKMSYTLEQLGLSNPFDRHPRLDTTWRGLQS